MIFTKEELKTFSKEYILLLNKSLNIIINSENNNNNYDIRDPEISIDEVTEIILKQFIMRYIDNNLIEYIEIIEISKILFECRNVILHKISDNEDILDKVGVRIRDFNEIKTQYIFILIMILYKHIKNNFYARYFEEEDSNEVIDILIANKLKFLTIDDVYVNYIN